MEIHAIALALAVSVVGVAVFARGVGSIVGVIGLGRPVVGRRDQPGRRWRHLLTETLGHTRMLQWNTIGVAHWFVFVAFGALFFTLITAYGQLFDPSSRCRSSVTGWSTSGPARSSPGPDWSPSSS